MLRRSFLAMLGFAPVAAVVKAKTVDTPPVPALSPEDYISVPSYKVSIPVKVPLTKEQVELCEIFGISPSEYAKNLLDLIEDGEIKSDLDKVVMREAIDNHDQILKKIKEAR